MNISAMEVFVEWQSFIGIEWKYLKWKYLMNDRASLVFKVHGVYVKFNGAKTN